MYKKVAIVGRGIGFEDAPDHGEVWGVNHIILKKKSVNRIFAMHSRQVIDSYGPTKATALYAKNNKIPFVTLEVREDIPTSEAYPLKEIIKTFRDYFSNSICYMIAYALYYGVESLDLYGVNMIGEYKRKKCVEYWLGVAEGKGIRVSINGPSSLLRTKQGFRYGYDLTDGY